jgi:hypothetical protein
MKKALLVCAASCGLAMSFAANAQQVGEYDGQTGDGNGVQILVAQDPNNNNLEVAAVGFGFSLLCKKSGDQKGTSWAIFFPDGNDIIGGKFSYSLAYEDSYLPFSMTFKGKKSVSGNTGLWDANINPAIGYSTPPKKAQLCVSQQPFTATFSGARVHLNGKPGTVVIRNKNSTTVASIKKN